VGLSVAGWMATSPVLAQPDRPDGGEAKSKEKDKPDFPPFKEVVEGYEQIVSTTDGEPPLYNIWRREKDSQLLAELPRGWQNQKHMFSMTVPSGELFAGLQTGDVYAYWKRYDKRIALVAPNIDVRASGDPEVKEAITHHFTDRVLL